MSDHHGPIARSLIPPVHIPPGTAEPVTLGRPLTEVELTRLGQLLDGLSDEEWEALRPAEVERQAGLDRYVVLRHGDDWQVVDLGPCSRQQPAKFMCTAVDDTTARTIAAALNEAQTGDLAERLELAEATIAELDELLLALHNADDPADADAADEILAESRARQEAR